MVGGVSPPNGGRLDGPLEVGLDGDVQTGDRRPAPARSGRPRCWRTPRGWPARPTRPRTPRRASRGPAHRWLMPRMRTALPRKSGDRVRRPGGVRQHRGGPDRAGASRDAGLDVTVETYFEWAIETAAVRRQRAVDSGRDLGGRPRAVHRAQAVHRQHRSCEHGVSRVRPGDQQAQRRAGRREVRAAVEGVLGETKHLLVAQARVRPGGRSRRTWRRSSSGSRIRTCRTLSTGSGGSRCASCPATSG